MSSGTGRTSAPIETEVDGHRLTLTNLDKVLFPADGFTKGALIDYYARIAPVMLHHLIDRPVTLRRFPNGVSGPSFYEKHAPTHSPAWISTMRVPRTADGTASRRVGVAPGEIEYITVGDRAALVFVANLAAIELHVPLWHAGTNVALPGPPDHLVFDLDPGPGTTIVECCEVALALAVRLTQGGHGEVVAKTSGSKGLQLYVPLPVGTGWEEARAEAFEIAAAVETDRRDLVVTNMRKDLRVARVLIDWSQNHPAKTTVAAYSVRGRLEPTVSTPVRFDEVETCARRRRPELLRFLPDDVVRRVERDGDLFALRAPPGGP